MQLSDGRRVDVALVRGEERIACEIAGTSTIDQEVANIEKCLSGPFGHVVAVSLDRTFLSDLGEALRERVRAADLERVSALSPEELLAFLKAQGPDVRESTVRGYEVKVRHKSGGDTDEESRRRTVADVMLKSVKRIRGGAT